MNELLEKFILDNELIGDNTYITDGVILLKKEMLDSYNKLTNLLIKIQTKEPIKIEYIPCDKGIEVEFPDKVELFPFGDMGVPFEDKFFGYNYIKLAHILTEDISFYTLVPPTEKFANAPWILKFWNENYEFVGCLAEMCATI